MSEYITNTDLLAVMSADISTRSLVHHHLDSFNNFTLEGVYQIITQNYRVEINLDKDEIAKHPDQDVKMIQILIEFTDVDIKKPTITDYQGREGPLMPNMARLQKLNYSCALYVDSKITISAILENGNEIVKTETINKVKIADIPCMVGSIYCHTYGMGKHARIQIQEDPQDIGGYFILNGNEWIISCLENTTYNKARIFRNKGHKKEITRLEMISKPGDAYENSAEIHIKLMEDGNIYITLTSVALLSFDIPFYVFFKLLGMSSHKTIIDNISYGYSTSTNPDSISDHMYQIVEQAFVAKDKYFSDLLTLTNRDDMVNYMAKTLSIMMHVKNKDSKYEENIGYINWIKTRLFDIIDDKLLPHVGTTPSDRYNKLRYLGHLIHELILVEYGVMESSTRDGLVIKRIDAAGSAYAKVLKRAFNNSIVFPLIKKFRHEMKAIQYDQVLLKQAFSATDSKALEKELVKSITTGDKEITVGTRTVANRLSSEKLTRKNQSHMISALNTVRTKQSKSAQNSGPRSKEMRQVYGDFIHFLDPNQSTATGDKVGVVKQKALSTFITSSSSSLLVKELMLRDPDIIPLQYVSPREIFDLEYTKILVNGDWIGCTSHAYKIVHKYREYRRGINFVDFDTVPEKFESRPMNKHVGIDWNTDDNNINLWTDSGRMMCLFLVVRNNGEQDPYGRDYFGSAYDPYKNTGFQQDCLLTIDMINDLRQKKYGIEKLVDDGIVEYLSPEEMYSVYIAYDINELERNRHNPLKPYTHCAIPTSVLGVISAISPFVENNDMARIIFNTNQTKQSSGIFALSWAYRMDKASSLQYYCEMPLITTISNSFIYPNGVNAMVAVLCYGGYNMEDSLIYNQGSADRGFAKNIHNSYVETELENNEHFAVPDSTTAGIKENANYNKMVNGVVPRGTVIHENDVLISKILKTYDNQQITTRDRSIMYKEHEEAIVVGNITAESSKATTFTRVAYSNVRKLGVGDKFSSRHGQKGMTGIGYLQDDMPFCNNGLQPDLILNPAALPSRMTIGQLIEALAGELCMKMGVITDASAFCENSIEHIINMLRSLGYAYDGKKTMFSGMTGEIIDMEVFLGPVYYQRLQKYAVEQIYYINTGNVEIITRQPLEGKSKNGGLKVSELAKDVINSHGAGHFVMEKMRDHSDDFYVYVCNTCGHRPIVNEKMNMSYCKPCELNNMVPDIYKVRTKYASQIFWNEIETLNIGIKLKVEPFTYEVEG